MPEYDSMIIDVDAAATSLAAEGFGRPSGKSERTRLALILAAERLFGELGIDAVGLRAISEAAYQKNNTSVQYHFGSKLALLNAIFEYREAMLQPQRQALFDLGEAQERLSDLRWLLRICFEPNFRLYRDRHDINYIKLHATYLTTHRPRGVTHPVDTDSPNCVVFRRRANRPVGGATGLPRQATHGPSSGNHRRNVFERLHSAFASERPNLIFPSMNCSRIP